MKLTYLKGDATSPTGGGKKLICHICNDLGVMGAGIALAIKQKWPQVYDAYTKQGLRQGDIQVVKISKDISVVNLIAQSGVGPFHELPPIRYQALQESLIRLRELVKPHIHRGISLHMPRIGTGLAGGKWDEIEKVLESVFGGTDINIFVYDLP